MTSRSERPPAENRGFPAICIRCPPSEFARAYRDGLVGRGVLTKFHGYGDGRSMQLPPPLGFSASLVDQLASGVRLALEYIDARYPHPRSLAEHYAARSPRVGGERPFPDTLPDQRHDQMQRQGLCPPVCIDSLMTSDGPQVIEFQTGYLPFAEIAAEIAAARTAGVGVDEGVTRTSEAAFRRMRETLVGKNGVLWLADVDSVSDGSVYDRVTIAGWLGGTSTLPLDLASIDTDAEDHVFFHEVSPGPGGTAARTGRRVPLASARAVLCRSTAQEIEELATRFLQQGEPGRISALARFLRSSRITWAWHPADETLLDKEELPRLRRYAAERGSPFLACLPHQYGAGTELRRGLYGLKPVDGNSGRGFLRLAVVGRGETPSARDPHEQVDRLEETGPGGTWPVPDGHLAQPLLRPAPIPVQVPATLRPERHLDGALELRSGNLPGSNEGSVIAYRIAPWLDPAGRPVMTNLGPAMRAFDRWMDAAGLDGEQRRDAIRRSMFGFGAAVPISGAADACV